MRHKDALDYFESDAAIDAERVVFLGYRFIARMKLPEPLASIRWILLVLVAHLYSLDRVGPSSARWLRE